jgi:hypothetical protein
MRVVGQHALCEYFPESVKDGCYADDGGNTNHNAGQRQHGDHADKLQ